MEFAYSLSMYSAPVRVRPANGRKSSSSTNTNTNINTNANANTNTYTFVHGANKHNTNNSDNHPSHIHDEGDYENYHNQDQDQDQTQNQDHEHNSDQNHKELEIGTGDQTNNSNGEEDQHQQDHKKTKKRKGSSLRSRIPGRRRPPPAGTLPQALAHRPASHYSHSRTSSSFSASSRTSHETQTHSQQTTRTQPLPPLPPLPTLPSPLPLAQQYIHIQTQAHYSNLTGLALTHAISGDSSTNDTISSSPPADSSLDTGASTGIRIGSKPNNGKGASAVTTNTTTTTATHHISSSSSSPTVPIINNTSNTKNSTVASTSAPAPPLTAASASTLTSIASVSHPSGSAILPSASDSERPSTSPKSSRFIKSIHIPIFSSDSGYQLAYSAGFPPTTNRLQKRDSIHYQASTAHSSRRPSTPAPPTQTALGLLSPARRRSSKSKHHDSMTMEPGYVPAQKYSSVSSRGGGVYAGSGSSHPDHPSIMTSNENLSSKEGSIAPSTASTSTKHSLTAAKAFIMRNNRLYINQPSLLYPLPIDLTELHRQSLRTLMLLQLFGGPTTAPEFSNKPPQRVLEVGCGSAFWSMMCHRYFAQHGHSSISFTGLDIAPLVGMGLDAGWRPDKDMRWRFVQHDVRRRPWPFIDGEFDLIMVKDMSLSLSTSMRDSQQLFEEYLRVLKPGGVIEFWESDHAVRMLRPHVLRAPVTSKAADSDSDSDDSSEEEDDVEKLGAYIMTNNTPLSAPLNPFLVEYNGWAIKGLDALGLSAVPCALIGAYLLQEVDTLMELRSKRIAVPLSEIRWEREGVGGVVTKDGKSYIDSMKRKGRLIDSRVDKRKGLTTSQAALRRTALETMVGLILCLEPIIREVSGKSQDEWDGWCGKMMNDLLREGGTSWGECLEVGAWCARKKLTPTS